MHFTLQTGQLLKESDKETGHQKTITSLSKFADCSHFLTGSSDKSAKVIVNFITVFIFYVIFAVFFFCLHLFCFCGYSFELALGYKNFNSSQDLCDRTPSKCLCYISATWSCKWLFAYQNPSLLSGSLPSLFFINSCQIGCFWAEVCRKWYLKIYISLYKHFQSCHCVLCPQKFFSVGFRHKHFLWIYILTSTFFYVLFSLPNNRKECLTIAIQSLLFGMAMYFSFYFYTKEIV